MHGHTEKSLETIAAEQDAWLGDTPLPTLDIDDVTPASIDDFVTRMSKAAAARTEDPSDG
jgi:hypothetical protein